MVLPKPAETVIHTLENAGFEAYVVGGCVRDALLGKEPKDYDIATSARPEQVEALFPHTVPTGKQHGTILVVEEGMPLEVTTFRTESGYQDHRHPDRVEFVQNIEEDLARRDFTINAMAWNPKTGLVDPFGGQQDLKDHIIRAVGDPEQRFQEDALRMIRAWRFAARLGFELDEATRQAIDHQERLIDQVAVERVVKELEEILVTNPQVLDQMTGLLKKWIPELEVMLHTEQNNVHHYTDVLHHTLDAMSACPSKDLDVRWALLLHDAGKPACKTTDASGDHFKKHPVESTHIARRVVRDLKLPRALARDIPDLVLYHDSFYAPKPSNLYKIMVERGWDDEKLNKLFAVQIGDIMAHTDHDRLVPLETFRTYYEQEKGKHPRSTKDLALNGHEVMEHTQLQGPQVKRAMELLLERAFYFPERNTKEQLLNELPAIEARVIKETKEGLLGKKRRPSRRKTDKKDKAASGAHQQNA